MVLTAKRKTEIADEEVTRSLEKEKYYVDTLYDEGGFIGDIQLPGPQRLDKYFSVDPATGQPLISWNDLPRMIDPDWEKWIRAGLAPGPESNYLKNLLREPGLLTEVCKDLVSLTKKYPNRYEGGNDAVAQSPGAAPAPLPASNSLPLPMAPAVGPTQPQVGGGAGSYGAP